MAIVQTEVDVVESDARISSDVHKKRRSGAFLSTLPDALSKSNTFPQPGLVFDINSDH